MRKLLLGLGTVAATIAPIATVVACSRTYTELVTIDEDKVEGNDKLIGQIEAGAAPMLANMKADAMDAWLNHADQEAGEDEDEVTEDDWMETEYAQFLDDVKSDIGLDIANDADGVMITDDYNLTVIYYLGYEVMTLVSEAQVLPTDVDDDDEIIDADAIAYYEAVENPSTGYDDYFLTDAFKINVNEIFEAEFTKVVDAAIAALAEE